MYGNHELKIAKALRTRSKEEELSFDIGAMVEKILSAHGSIHVITVSELYNSEGLREYEVIAWGEWED